MDIKEVLSIGIKVVAASLAAVAAFVGVGEIFSKKKEEKAAEAEGPEEGSVEESAEAVTDDVGKGEKLVQYLEKTQAVTSKFFVLIQSVMTVVNVIRMIGNCGNSTVAGPGLNPFGAGRFQYHSNPNGSPALNPNNDPWRNGQMTTRAHIQMPGVKNGYYTGPGGIAFEN